MSTPMTTPTETPTENHCRDCCCARSWKALGITEYTGKSIPEHIAELKSQLTAATAQLASVLEDRARFPDKPDDVGRMIEAHMENLKALAARHEQNWRDKEIENCALKVQLGEARRALKQFGQHYEWCASMNTNGPDCNCGYEKSLAAMTNQKEEK